MDSGRSSRVWPTSAVTWKLAATIKQSAGVGRNGDAGGAGELNKTKAGHAFITT